MDRFIFRGCVVALAAALLVPPAPASAADEPDLIFKPNVGVFRLFEFFRASAVMRAADPIKAEVKKRVGALL